MVVGVVDVVVLTEMDGNPVHELVPRLVLILMSAAGDDVIADELEHLESFSWRGGQVWQGR